ncbi:MAG: Nif3-like dinuclear metal center hexameric protein [Clostridia bacterium]|nr:Nif3-like dinuclear metal center hexameric protein [Clostridia bacterium]
MTLIKDIVEFCEEFAPFDTAASFDNVGLLIGSENTEVTKVLLALDITKEVIAEAKETGAQLIISHHPVIFNPLKSMDSKSVPYLLAANCLSALCLHTNLDIAWDTGVNLCLANALKLEGITFYEGEFVVSGTLKEETTAENFAKFVKEKLNAQAVTCTVKDKLIKNIFMCSGAGGSEFMKAVELGADAFITGEAHHHNYLESIHKNVPLIVAGHFETEDIVINPLKEKLQKEFNEVEFVKSEKLTSPLYFV